MEVVAEISAHFSSFILVSLLEVHLFLWIQIARGGPAHRKDWFSLNIAQNIQFFVWKFKRLSGFENFLINAHQNIGVGNIATLL